MCSGGSDSALCPDFQDFRVVSDDFALYWWWNDTDSQDTGIQGMLFALPVCVRCDECTGYMFI